MSTLSDLIQKVTRRLVGSQREITLVLGGSAQVNYILGSTTLIAYDPSGAQQALAALRPGVLLAIDLEIFYVEAVSGSGNVTVTVVPGYQGSTEANHSAGALIYVQPKFPAFDVMNAINEDIDDLSSPDNGLYAVGSTDIVYNPVIRSYDLVGVSTDFIDIIDVRFQTPLPDQYLLPIRDWRVERNQSASYFPSGMALTLYGSGTSSGYYGGGFPGLNMHVLYKKRFTSLANLTDDLVSVSGFNYTSRELPWMGAFVSLAVGREVKRNFTEAQSDARKSSEVPPGAVMNAANGILRLRQSRISAEAGRLYQQYEARVAR